MMGSECGWGLGEGPNFQFSRGPYNCSSRGSSLMQTIAETCVRFDAAHLSINLVSEIASEHAKMKQSIYLKS